jgi:type III pantothenate kinase
VILAIDAGNSALKLARLDGTEAQSRQRMPASGADAEPDRTAMAQRAIADGVAGGVDAAVLVSVVPAWTAAFRQAATEANLELVMADHSTIPLPVHLSNPAGVGADRLINAYGAARLHGIPVIVVDLGTATTVDVVDATGAFVGGAILPGVELSARALAAGTAQLPKVDIDGLPSPIGRDTQGAIASGVVLGQVGAVRELLERMSREVASGTGIRPTVVVTGGWSRAAWANVWLEATTGHPAIATLVDPDLTLRGLGLLHAELARTPA